MEVALLAKMIFYFSALLNAEKPGDEPGFRIYSSLSGLSRLNQSREVRIRIEILGLLVFVGVRDNPRLHPALDLQATRYRLYRCRWIEARPDVRLDLQAASDLLVVLYTKTARFDAALNLRAASGCQVFVCVFHWHPSDALIWLAVLIS